MDLQFVCDAYACISYIVAYVTKDEKEMSQMLKLAASEMRNADVKTRLKHIGYVFLGNREISAQEAAYRLLGIPLKRCNTKVVWIPTDFKENRISILKSQNLLDDLEDDSTDVYCKSIVDKYAIRPFIPIFSNTCLAQFASMYDRATSQSKSFTNDESENEQDPSLPETDVHQELPKIITLQDTDVIMKKRTNPAVPRWHVVSENKNPEKYYHQQLLLFVPWRREEEDLLKENTFYEESYNDMLTILTENKNHIAEYASLVSQAVEQFQENGPPQHAWDMLDPEGNLQINDRIQKIGKTAMMTTMRNNLLGHNYIDHQLQVRLESMKYQTMSSKKLYVV
ncbi:Hypothetical predicted protein [Mytilus galloprovincialis]|uniref:Uncharacterized protein n=1 Tax=Mytilus galloprovincialis TaxID=29158 RepID=A0A8B6CQ58_MYTGA|nr:Hypothetical predicted protein [Mytilus galloprovincialis]